MQDRVPTSLVDGTARRERQMCVCVCMRVYACVCVSVSFSISEGANWGLSGDVGAMSGSGGIGDGWVGMDGWGWVRMDTDFLFFSQREVLISMRVLGM